MSNAENSTQWTSAIGGKLPTRDALLIALQQQHGHISSLEIETDQADDVADKKSEVIASQKKRIEQLEEYLRLARQKRFAPSIENNVLQGELFNEAELLADGEGDDNDPPLEDTEEQSKPRKKRGGRKGLCPSLPRVQKHHHLSDEENEYLKFLIDDIATADTVEAYEAQLPWNMK